MPRQITRIIKDTTKLSNLCISLALGDSFMYSQRTIWMCLRFQNCRKVPKKEKGFQTTLSNYISYLPPGLIFITASTAHWVFLKSASQWVTKCEICVLTFLTNHLTARVQNEFELLYQRWWDGGFFNSPEQKIISGFKTAASHAFS